MDRDVGRGRLVWLSERIVAMLMMICDSVILRGGRKEVWGRKAS